MADINHLLRDLRFTEFERVEAFMPEIAEAKVPERLVNALIYRLGFVDGRKDERRRQEEKRVHIARHRAAEAAAETTETIEEVNTNE